MFAPSYCSYPTQTQYHRELRDTVMAPMGLGVAQTQWRATVDTHIHMYKHSRVMGSKCKWIYSYVYIPLPVFDHRMRIYCMYKYCNKSVIPFTADPAVRGQGAMGHTKATESLPLIASAFYLAHCICVLRLLRLQKNDWCIQQNRILKKQNKGKDWISVPSHTGPWL